MEPIARADHNHIYKGEHYRRGGGPTVNEGVGDLSCRVDGMYTFAHFRPTEEELELLNEGEVIELHVMGHPIPPLGVEVVPRKPRTTSTWRSHRMEMVRMSPRGPGFTAGFASCCVLSFNRIQFLRQSLNSMKAHAEYPMEIIVHDDGSTQPMLPAYLETDRERRGLDSHQESAGSQPGTGHRAQPDVRHGPR
jgi:hypothetical protein